MDSSSSDVSRRRNIAPSSHPLSPAQGGDVSLEPSDTSPAVSSTVLYTLLGFTAAMAIVPIGSYFLTLRVVFGGNSTYAGGFAAVMANVVLIAYIVVAMREDELGGSGTGGGEKKQWGEKEGGTEGDRERSRSGGGRGVVEGKKAQ